MVALFRGGSNVEAGPSGAGVGRVVMGGNGKGNAKVLGDGGLGTGAICTIAPGGVRHQRNAMRAAGIDQVRVAGEHLFDDVPAAQHGGIAGEQE